VVRTKQQLEFDGNALQYYYVTPQFLEEDSVSRKKKLQEQTADLRHHETFWLEHESASFEHVVFEIVQELWICQQASILIENNYIWCNS